MYEYMAAQGVSKLNTRNALFLLVVEEMAITQDDF